MTPAIGISALLMSDDDGLNARLNANSRRERLSERARERRLLRMTSRQRLQRIVRRVSVTP